MDKDVLIQVLCSEMRTCKNTHEVRQRPKYASLIFRSEKDEHREGWKWDSATQVERNEKKWKILRRSS